MFKKIKALFRGIFKYTPVNNIKLKKLLEISVASTRIIWNFKPFQVAFQNSSSCGSLTSPLPEMKKII